MEFELEYSITKKFINGDFKKQAEVISCKGVGSELVIPERIVISLSGETDNTELVPVTHIGKKACLGNKYIKKVIIPDTITGIDSWAFAQCENLKTITCNKMLKATQDYSGEKADCEKIRFGKGVFEDCLKLEEIYLPEFIDIESETERNGLAHLLAAAVIELGAEQLLNMDKPGESPWYEKWDSCLMKLMEEKDDYGYFSTMLCGEEDIQSSLKDFICIRKRKKAQLGLTRLMYDFCISDALRDRIITYITNNFWGEESNEAWHYVLEEHGNDLSYYKLLTGAGIIHRDNIDMVIKDMKNGYVEPKAYLTAYKNTHYKTGDAFDVFDI